MEGWLNMLAFIYDQGDEYLSAVSLTEDQGHHVTLHIFLKCDFSLSEALLLQQLTGSGWNQTVISADL